MDGSNPTCCILLVDDHKDTRVVMTKLLQHAGHFVESASSYSSALERGKQRRFDLLITDIGLPDKSGLQLLAALRELYPIRGIVVSGYETPSHIEKSRAAGFTHYLTKPIETSDLYAAVDNECGVGAHNG